MDLGRALQGVLQLLQREFLGAGDLKDRRLAAGAELTRLGQFRRHIDRDHDRAMAIGVEKVRQGKKLRGLFP